MLLKVFINGTIITQFIIKMIRERREKIKEEGYLFLDMMDLKEKNGYVAKYIMENLGNLQKKKIIIRINSFKIIILRNLKV